MRKFCACVCKGRECGLGIEQEMSRLPLRLLKHAETAICKARSEAREFRELGPEAHSSLQGLRDHAGLSHSNGTLPALMRRSELEQCSVPRHLGVHSRPGEQGLPGVLDLSLSKVTPDRVSKRETDQERSLEMLSDCP